MSLKAGRWGKFKSLRMQSFQIGHYFDIEEDKIFSMGNRFHEIAFTDLVKAHQQEHGSRRQYERMAQAARSVEASASAKRRSSRCVTASTWPR